MFTTCTARARCAAPRGADDDDVAVGPRRDASEAVVRSPLESAMRSEPSRRRRRKPRRTRALPRRAALRGTSSRRVAPAAIVVEAPVAPAKGKPAPSSSSSSSSRAEATDAVPSAPAGHPLLVVPPQGQHDLPLEDVDRGPPSPLALLLRGLFPPMLVAF